VKLLSRVFTFNTDINTDTTETFKFAYGLAGLRRDETIKLALNKMAVTGIVIAILVPRRRIHTGDDGGKRSCRTGPTRISRVIGSNQLTCS